MNPFYVVRRMGPTRPKIWTEKESWSRNEKLYVGNDQNHPLFAVAPGRTPTEPVMFILGGGGLHREEMAELCERIREKGRENKPKENFMDMVREAFERRMNQHKRNPVTDPAPNYLRGF